MSPRPIGWRHLCGGTAFHPLSDSQIHLILFAACFVVGAVSVTRLNFACSLLTPCDACFRHMIYSQTKRQSRQLLRQDNTRLRYMKQDDVCERMTKAIILFTYFVLSSRLNASSPSLYLIAWSCKNWIPGTRYYVSPLFTKSSHYGGT